MFYIPNPLSNAELPLRRQHWYVYPCKNGQSLTFIDRDLSEGLRPIAPGRYVHACNACQTRHTFDESEVVSVGVV